MSHIDMSLYACAGDVGKNIVSRVYKSLSRWFCIQQHHRKPDNYIMFCAGVGVVIVISTPMPHIDMSTKPDNYIMFCVGVGVIIPTPMPHIQN